MKTWTYKISDPRIEGTQRGYLVTVARAGMKRGDLTSYADSDAGYKNACACVESIKRGVFVASRNGLSFLVSGRTLTVTCY